MPEDAAHRLLESAMGGSVRGDAFGHSVRQWQRVAIQSGCVETGKAVGPQPISGLVGDSEAFGFENEGRNGRSPIQSEEAFRC